MADLNTTKKFPKALNRKGHMSARTDFVIPSPDGSCEFVELKKGKKHAVAYLVYVGAAINAEDVLAKVGFTGFERNRLLAC